MIVYLPNIFYNNNKNVKQVEIRNKSKLRLCFFFLSRLDTYQTIARENDFRNVFYKY